MKVGITGGIGCGKSTVACALEQRGFRRLDSDRIVRDEVLTAPAVIAALRGRYGDAVLEVSASPSTAASEHAPVPRMNRAALAERVFAAEAERLWLEELTHPRVVAAWTAAFASAPAARWAVEVPLLFEKGLEKGFDFTVCVACAPDLQLARLEQRGLPRALAGQRISNQLPLTQKIDRSDFVLWNEGSPSFLEAQVDRLVQALAAA